MKEGVTVHYSCDDCRIYGNTHHDEACQAPTNGSCKQFHWCDAHGEYLDDNDSGDEDDDFENENCNLCEHAVDFKERVISASHLPSALTLLVIAYGVDYLEYNTKI